MFAGLRLREVPEAVGEEVLVGLFTVLLGRDWAGEEVAVVFEPQATSMIMRKQETTILGRGRCRDFLRQLDFMVNSPVRNLF